jgi:uncharacterized membrane protein
MKIRSLFRMWLQSRLVLFVGVGLLLIFVGLFSFLYEIVPLYISIPLSILISFLVIFSLSILFLKIKEQKREFKEDFEKRFGEEYK